jgi:serine/threonine-protein kinase
LPTCAILSSRVELTEDELKPGLVLGRYELLAPVAKGGMAQVWAARMSGTRGFHKTVAIKTMLPNLTEDPQFEQMFLDEAALASRVRHPNAVEIFDLGEDAGILYLVMEWIDGEPLSAVMKQAFQNGGGIPLRLAIRIVMHACAGLHAAHELKDDSGELVGLVHRDVSPQNILVTYSGVVKVVDFGVAKATGRASVETAAGQIKGKVPYMSPEQATGGEIDRRTDVFALGILLYMMTTGRHPFRKENDAQTLMFICSDTPIVPPSAFIPDFPSDLEQAILKAMDRNVDHRFQSANEMQKALDSLSSELRSSSEEELGDFMKALLPERMLKRQALIQRALKEAAGRSEGRTSIVDVGDELSGGQLTPMSGVSHLSKIGRAAAVSSTAAGVEVESAAGSPSGSPPLSIPPRGARRALRTAVPLFLAAVTGVGVYLATSRGSAPPAPGAAAGQAVAAEAARSGLEPGSMAPAGTASAAPVAPAESAAAVVDMVLDDDSPRGAPSAKPGAGGHRPASAGRFVPGKPALKPAGGKIPASDAPKAAEAAKPAGTRPFVSPFRDPGF